MSTIKVENLTGITSGANANKVIVPAGQTLVPSSGQIVHTERVLTTADITVSGTTYTDVWTINYTPKLTTSNVIFQYNALIRNHRDGSHDSRSNLRVLHNGSAVYTVTDIGDYDYGNSGTWHKWQFSDATQYSNTNGSQITWKLQLSKSGATDTRFGEAATTSGTSVITEVVQ